MLSKTFAATAVASLMASVNAHMAIQAPVPIPGSDSKSPLDPSGSNFPCQGANLNTGTVTNMAVGSQQPLQWNLGGGANWAVHGGGSCQISITYETDPTALKDPTNWKVIHSFLGGCPTNAPGNLDPQAVACAGTTDGTNCVDQGFTFQIPPEVKNGAATLAWTWFNNIGNREMYMNCARVNFSGGNGNIASLPSMFVANIGNGCSTTEQFSTQFANPGQYVTNDPTLNYPFKAGVGTCNTSPGSGSASGSGSGSAASAAPASSASGGSGTFAEGAAAPAAASGSAVAAPTTAAAAAATASPAAAVAAPAAAGSAGAAVSGSVPCSSEGFYCISATTFGLCNNGYAIPQQVAPGTTCTNNAIAAASKERRFLNIRHMRHRRHWWSL